MKCYLVTSYFLLFLITTVQCRSVTSKCFCSKISFKDEKIIQKRLYRELYLSIYNSIKPLSQGKNSVDLILRRTGLLLKYSQFEVPQLYKDVKLIKVNTKTQYSSNDSTAAIKGETVLRAVLPPWVVQSMFDISDTIPNISHWIANSEDYSNNNNNNNRFSSSYKLVINKILEHMRKVNFHKLKNVYSYLKEPLSDGSHYHSNDTINKRNNTAARLVLYNRYKTDYYNTKVLVETLINSNKKTMSRKEYKWWHSINNVKLIHQIKECLQRWYQYGQKKQVEDWLSHTHAFNEVHNIEAAKKLLRAYKQPAWDQYSSSESMDTTDSNEEESFIYRVRFLPLDWFEHLKLKFFESKDQIKYRIKENEKTIKRLRKLKENALEMTNSPEYIQTYRAMKKRYITQKTKLMKTVIARKYNTQMCRFTTRKKYCKEVTRLRPIIDKLQSRHAAIHWEYYKFKTPLPKYGGHVMKSIDKEINASLNITIELTKLLKEHSMNHYNDSDVSINETIPIQFQFNPQNIPQKVKRFNDFKLPRKLTESRLWYLNRDKTNNKKVNKTISKYLQTVEGYLNSIVDQITVNVSLIKVDIERKWFNQTLFKTLMKLSKADFLVSPGPQSNPSKFRKIISSNNYLLPAFPTSLLIATDIHIGLPPWLPSNIIKDLLSLSYEPRVNGGFGPFSFGYMFGSRGDKGSSPGNKKRFKFRIDIFKNRNITMSIPGSQLIGYMCNIVNKFPF